ncbi:hypothetical protein DPMN_128551 [Dreissena polymorpha]|uniref:Uncharacterized protein n=1 Tax=Dreissena polymorpha TaxID=45954 RepID=A0A9D4JZS8_DREPO|nr:hypothetical protein DPMN_128551 [Dreissena polymorpha]
MVPRLSGLKPETPRSIPDQWSTCRDSKTVCDGAMTVWATAGYSQTVPECLQDRRGTCRRLPDSLRRCQTISQNGGQLLRLPDSLRRC